MKRICPGHAKWLLFLSLVWLSLRGQPVSSDEPAYTSAGQLLRPGNYREWVYLSSGLGMTYGIAEGRPSEPVSQRFDNVFVTPSAYKVFQKTGTWPDKVMFVLEVRSSASKGSINKGGHYQEEVIGVEVHVKDQKRFRTKWEFFEFGTAAQTAKPLGPQSTCQACHSTNGAVDETFVQFYPTLLPAAKAHGTFKGEK